jgi:hypothetical protein
MDELLIATLEVERVLAKLGETPFELMTDEQEKGSTIDAIVRKQVSALNESLINFFRQGITPSHGAWSPSTIIVPICKICRSSDHVATIYPRTRNLKPKCGKCGLPHKMENCGYCSGMGHIEK